MIKVPELKNIYRVHDLPVIENKVSLTWKIATYIEVLSSIVFNANYDINTNEVNAYPFLKLRTCILVTAF